MLKNIDSLVNKVIKELKNPPMKLTEDVKVSKALQYHLNKKLTLTENVFEVYSEKYFNLINEVRELYENNLIRLCEEDISIIETDLGKKVMLESGEEVYLDAPIYEDDNWGMVNEAEYQGRKVQLGKIMQGDVKKFKVYVKNDKGSVVKVNFGFGGKSAKGKRMPIKKNNPARRKSFRARHNCDNPGPRWKARYWACRTW
jgi:hypothetical protein